MKRTKIRMIMAYQIKTKYVDIMGNQVSAGIYLQNIGQKYITLLNTHGGSRLEKILIEDFYRKHFAV